MRAGWRISFMCTDPECADNHRITGSSDEILTVARSLVEGGCTTMLIQEETVALMAELDLAEEGRRDPSLVTDLTLAYKKFGVLHAKRHR